MDWPWIKLFYLATDLTTPDNSLWGLIKGQVSGVRYETIEKLQYAIIAAFASVSRNSLKKWHKEPGGEWNCA